MKIKMSNGTELTVARLNRTIGNSDQVAETLMINFGKNVTLDDVVAAITEDTVKEFTVVREGFEDKKYTGYSIQNFTEDTSAEDTTVNAFLVKLTK